VIVLDASVVVEWLLRTPVGLKVEARLLRERTTLHAPHLIDLEVAQALRRLITLGDIDARDAEEVLADWEDAAVMRHPHDVFLWRIWELRGNLTAYDAAYVALAEAIGASILTCDAKVARARGHHASVEVVKAAG
jgi:predicted nucleic acid-binding protein